MSFFTTYRWYLIQSQLPARTPTIEAELVVATAKEQQESLPLSVTFKGRLFEVIRLDRETRPVEVQLSVDGKQTDSYPVSIKKISRLQAYYWMWHRLIFMHTVLSRALRQRTGFYREINKSLYGAYRLISAFRYHYPAPNYQEWLARYWQLQPMHSKAIEQFQAQIKNLYSFSVVIDGRVASTETIKITVSSVEKQVGFNTRPIVWLAKQALPAMKTDFVLYVKAGCILRPWAVAWFMWQQHQQPKALCIYSDHDYYTDGQGFTLPQFKPDWSLEFQRNSGYVGEVLWLEREAFLTASKALNTDVSAYSLILEIGLMHARQIDHISSLLWSAPENTQTEVSLTELREHLKRHQVQATVDRDQRGLVRTQYALPSPLPKVSIIIPTRDLFHMLRPCIESVLKHTQWPNYEILIVDNQSSCPQTLAYMRQLEQQEKRIRIISYNKPFNYSAINNYAVAQAQGEIICLLNNDTEVISPDWLEEMVSRLLQPKVGVVGARLYFTDGRVQHAGDVVGVGGCATHLYGILEANDLGYMNRAVTPQDLSAVTAACLVTHKVLYQQLGGLNAQDLTVAFNDVDYCLRVREAGYAVIYSPYAELYHHESVSRGKEDDPIKKARAKAEASYMRKRWREVVEGDPYYNPNLNFTKADFTLSKVPQTDWPWVK